MVFHTKEKLQKLKFKTHLTGFSGTILKKNGSLCVCVSNKDSIIHLCELGKPKIKAWEKFLLI